MLPALAVAAVAAPVIGGIVGNMMGAKDRQAAMDAINRAYGEYAHLDIPDTEKMKLALQNPEVQGIMQPYLEQAQQMGPTAYEDINIDPRLKQAQMNALDTLSKMGETGLTSADMAALNQSRRAVAGDAQSRQKAIMQSMQERGAGGSGVELAAQLAAAQGQADRGSQEADRLAQMAQERMLQAVAQAGTLGGNIRGQDFSEAERLAQAKDQIAQFNTQQSAAVQSRNIAAQNAAQAQNLAEKQRIADTAVNNANQQQQYNKQLLQQNFQNQMNLAAGRAGALGGQAQMLQGNANAAGQMWSGIGSGVGQGLLGVGMMNKSGGTAAAPAVDAAGGTTDYSKDYLSRK